MKDRGKPGRKKLPAGRKREKPPITLPRDLIDEAARVAELHDMTLSDYALLSIKNQLARESRNHPPTPTTPPNKKART